MQLDRRARLQPGQGAAAGADQIANTIDVDHRLVCADGFNLTFEHSDHAALPIDSALR